MKKPSPPHQATAVKAADIASENSGKAAIRRSRIQAIARTRAPQPTDSAAAAISPKY